MNNYQWCDDKGRYIPQAVCEKNISEGKCKKTRSGCQRAKKMKLSGSERKKRSRRMKRMWKVKRAERAEAEQQPKELQGEDEVREAKDE